MTQVAVSAGHGADTSTGIANGKLGMWLFLASDAMTFTCAIAAYVVLRYGSVDWPIPSTVLDVPLTALNTFILICSSLSMVLAFSAIERGNQAGLVKWLAVTALGGAMFLGIQAYEWNHLLHAGVRPSTSLIGATFYTLTGFHGAHVFSGVVYILVIMIRGMRGAFTAQHFLPVELLGLYWHFVDLIWIVIFTVVYLI